MFSALMVDSTAARLSTSLAVLLPKHCWRSQTVSKGRSDRGQIGEGDLFFFQYISSFSVLCFGNQTAGCSFPLLSRSVRLQAGLGCRLGSATLPYRCGSSPWLLTIRGGISGGKGFQEMLFGCWAQNALFPWWLCVKSVCPYLFLPKLISQLAAV